MLEDSRKMQEISTPKYYTIHMGQHDCTIAPKAEWSLLGVIIGRLSLTAEGRNRALVLR